jgi:hypothetical protein
MAVIEPSRQSIWAIIRQHCRVQLNPGPVQHHADREAIRPSAPRLPSMIPVDPSIHDAPVLDRIGQTFDSFGPAAGKDQPVEAFDPQLRELAESIAHSARPVLFASITSLLLANCDTSQGMSFETLREFNR